MSHSLKPIINNNKLIIHYYYEQCDYFKGNLEGQVRDANWRLQQLQTQYDFLASKTSSQGTAFKDAEERLEVQ